MTVSYVAQLIGWWTIGSAFIAVALVVAGRYMDRHSSPVERIAEDRLAHVKAYAARRPPDPDPLEDLYRLPSR